jgi:hypothetical protein
VVVAAVVVTGACSNDEYLVSTPWKLMAKPHANTIPVVAFSGGCIRFERIDVDERPNEVILTALSRDLAAAAPTPEPGQAPMGCNGDLQLNVIPVCLRAPLGRRPLSHAAVSIRWDGPDAQTYSIPPAMTPPKPCDYGQAIR